MPAGPRARIIRLVVPPEPSFRLAREPVVAENVRGCSNGGDGGDGDVDPQYVQMPNGTPKNNFPNLGQKLNFPKNGNS